MILLLFRGAFFAKKLFTPTTRYENGELVTKERMEDEPWYPDYQDYMEFVMGEFVKERMTVGELYENYMNYFRGKRLSRKKKERILRWCVLHSERMSSETFKEIQEKFKNI